ncbi:hypothetical protein GCM10010466_10290 [Planomonospora alba]|uniref:Uncharacterized protein n=1 Tax=Planomonospora alba TaxID=161354 RepID=A0ABP6MPA8_9ACTN
MTASSFRVSAARIRFCYLEVQALRGSRPLWGGRGAGPLSRRGTFARSQLRHSALGVPPNSLRDAAVYHYDPDLLW